MLSIMFENGVSNLCVHGLLCITWLINIFRLSFVYVCSHKRVYRETFGLTEPSCSQGSTVWRTWTNALGNRVRTGRLAWTTVAHTSVSVWMAGREWTVRPTQMTVRSVLATMAAHVMTASATTTASVHRARQVCDFFNFCQQFCLW